MGKSSKKIKIIIAIIFVIIVIAAGAFAYLYFATDVFKSSKELFYSSLTKNEEILNGLNISNNVASADEIFKDKAYTTDGELAVSYNIKYNDNMPSLSDTVKLLKIEGKTDEVEKQDYKKISLVNNEEELFNFEYLNMNDIYALTSNQIVNVYLGIQNNNLKDFVRKLGIEDVSKIPNKIEKTNSMENMQISEEQIKNVFSKYANLFVEQVPEEKYSKQKDASMQINGQNYENLDVYTLSLSKKDLVNVLNPILQTLKEDEEALNVILELYQKEKTLDNLNDIKEQIQDIIDNVDSIEQTDDDGFKIVLYSQNDNLINTRMQLGNEADSGIIVDITYSKTEQETNIKLDVSDIEDEEYVFTINLALNQANGIKIEYSADEYTFGINYSDKIIDENTANKQIALYFSQENGNMLQISYDEEKKIAQNVTIDKLDTNSNCVILNDYPEEQLMQLMEQIGQRLTEIFNDIGEKIPVTQMINSIATQIGNAYQMHNSQQEIIEDANSQMSEQEKAMFNSRFTAYEGIMRGSNVKSLLNTVSSSNQTSDTKIEVNINNNAVTQNLDNAITQINTSDEYNVSFEYSDEGYINTINITQ